MFSGSAPAGGGGRVFRRFVPPACYFVSCVFIRVVGFCNRRGERETNVFNSRVLHPIFVCINYEHVMRRRTKFAISSSTSSYALDGSNHCGTIQRFRRVLLVPEALTGKYWKRRSTLFFDRDALNALICSVDFELVVFINRVESTTMI